MQAGSLAGAETHVAVDFISDSTDNDCMDSTPTTTELQEAADRAAKGIRDPEARRQASQRLDQLREAVRRRVGIVDVAVEFVREAREE